MRLSALAVSLSLNFVTGHVLEARDTDWKVGQTVSTSSGPVNGHDAGNDASVSEYLGIPFAEPPVGALRFAAPKRFTGNATRDATKFGPSCLTMSSAVTQKTNDTSSQSVVVQDIFLDESQTNEDCLYLNVWTKPQVGEKKKAVMVWIYGGAFSSGSSSIAAYNGRNLAALEDVVVVSMNYRLNIFGFPAHPNGTYNVALLDQRMAIEWVRDNIENFGGDSKRITLFGQSAGGASVDFHSYAWASDPIASGYIIESGNVFSWGLPNNQNSTGTAWLGTAEKLGCGNANSPMDDVLTCMRSKTPTEIYAAVPASPASQILGSFGPTADEIVVFSNYSDRKPSDLPILIGNNNYEAGLFRTEFEGMGIKLTETFWTDFNLQEFTCPCSDRANASLAANVDTWRYRYMGVFPDLAISPTAGTWHAAEVPMLFNTLPQTPPPTPEQDSIAKYMRGAWSAFAKDPHNGLTKYGWPKYDPTMDTLVRIANDNKVGPNLINPYRYDADCPFVNVSSIDPTKFSDLPDLGANVTPTGANGGNPVETAPPAKASSGETLTAKILSLVITALFTSSVLLL